MKKNPLAELGLSDLLFTSPTLQKCQYLKKYQTDFSQIQSDWSASKSFKIYADVQSKMAVGCCYENSKNMKMTILQNLWMNLGQYYVRPNFHEAVKIFTVWPPKIAALCRYLK